MADQPSDPRIGTAIGGYRILERIGRGGMGVVYRADHMTLHRQAAIKLIAPELGGSDSFRERFLREARTAAGLTHPNVVTVYDAGEAGDLLYIAMQYVPGRDLAKVLAREGRLGPYRALDVCRQVAGALDAAHEAGLIHRDVKPGNVLIDGRQAYLTDFGLTKERLASGTQLTRSGEVVGTTHYLAPEQVEGRQVDGRADVYALGCLLFHCLTGEVVFPRDNDMSVMYAHVHEEPPKMSSKRPGLPAGLDAVMDKALDKAPERRFATCEELVMAARAVLDAHGPLAESSSTRKPASSPSNQPPSDSTPSDARPESQPSNGQAVRGRGESSSLHTLTGVVGPGGRPIIVLLAGVDAGARAVARVAIGHRCEVLEATTAEEATAQARDRRPDVVVMPADSPLAAEVAAAVRQDPVTRDAKIVVLAPDRKTARRAMNLLGADDSLPVPFSPLQMQVQLRRMLGKRSSES